jgi:hypothetical protein
LIYLSHGGSSHPTGLLRETLVGHLTFASPIAALLAAAAVVACNAAIFAYVDRSMRKWLYEEIRGEADVQKEPTIAGGGDV